MNGSSTLLSQLLGLKEHDKIAVVGAGGKTSIISLLAQQNRANSVLISPTTKIYSPVKIGAPHSRFFPSEEASLAAKAESGITYAGVLNPSTQKLSCLPLGSLSQICEQYDFCFLEADGSRALACKGWMEDEPVIPDFITTTLGIITLRGLQKPAVKETVLHLPQFLALTGLQENEPITMGALAKMVTNPLGMFKNSLPYSQQKLHLIINQVENIQSEKSALSFANTIQSTSEFPIQTIIFGSAHKNTWQLIE